MAYLNSRSRSSLAADRLRVAGVMTGTSCDGLDIACVELTGTAEKLAMRPLWSASTAYPSSLRKRVLRAQIPEARHVLADLLRLNRDLGRWSATAIARAIRSHRPAPHLIANHGQTLGHFPAEGLTLQLGDPSVIARVTGISVASSFREGDLSAGGQGAPLAPRFHSLLASRLGPSRLGRSIHNIGGISNLSYFAPGEAQPLAFDTGPGGIWIDAAAAAATRGRLSMDVDGRLVRAGTADERAVEALLRHPYFRKKAPKSTGRDEFPFSLLTRQTRAKGADLVATATAVTARSIALAYQNTVLRKSLSLGAIYFCGGGAKNPALLDMVRRSLPGVQITTLDRAGHDSQLIEAQAFAYFGCRALLGSPIGGKWTGATGFAPPGHLVPGENWRALLSRIAPG